jgi:hypothetical protein
VLFPPRRLKGGERIRREFQLKETGYFTGTFLIQDRKSSQQPVQMALNQIDVVDRIVSKELKEISRTLLGALGRQNAYQPSKDRFVCRRHSSFLALAVTKPTKHPEVDLIKSGIRFLGIQPAKSFTQGCVRLFEVRLQHVREEVLNPCFSRTNGIAIIWQFRRDFSASVRDGI